MEKKSLKTKIISMVIVFGLAVCGGCASSKAAFFADPMSADTSWLRIGNYIQNESVIDEKFNIEQFDNEEVDWNTDEVIAIAPGEHTVIADSKYGPISHIFTAAPASYYRLDVNTSFEGKFVRNDEVRKEIIITDETYDILHGVGGKYDLFSKAENKAGVTRLSGGVGLLRAPDGKAHNNFGVYDLTVAPADLVTLRINASDGVLIVTGFDGKPVSWYGYKFGHGIEGGVVRIPSGQHTLTASYRSQRGSLSIPGGYSSYTTSQGARILGGAVGLIGFGISAIDKAVKDSQAKKRDTDGIQLAYDFAPGAEYELIFIKDPSKGGPYAAMEIIPGKGAPAGQQRGSGFVSADSTVSSVVTPATVSQPAAVFTGQYFVSINEQPGGPYSFDELKQLVREDKLSKDSLVWKEGMAQWVKAESVAEFASVFTAVPPPLPAAGQAAVPAPAAPPPLPGQTVSPLSETGAEYRVGDMGPAGGIVFYDKGNNNGGWRYLEAAPQNLPMKQWGVYRENVVTGGKIGDGKTNTQRILAMLAKRKETDRAAQLCGTLKLNGYDDWFLPSTDELDLLYKVLKGKNLLDGFEKNWYWTSTQEGRKNAFIIHFGNGRHNDTDKDHRNYILPVRAW
jgi:hypothetical protein